MPVKDASGSRKYAWRSIQAYLEGSKELPWILGVIRASKLFYGERNVVIEDTILHLRHVGAHPHVMFRVDAISSARFIRDRAELINPLWGRPTPGGRLYPKVADEAVS